MQLLAPDIITEARGLSATVSGIGLGLGVLLWLTGWWAHRFWIVLVTTVAAGVVGLRNGPVQLQPIVAALLLALAAGMLALPLVRVVAFAAGGLAAWLVFHTLVAPPWNEPLVCFLGGGLAGLLLFRLWIMALTSFAGALGMTYFGLCLADRLGKLNAVVWAEERGALLNWVCVGLVLVGLVGQLLLERFRLLKKYRRKEKEIHRSEKALLRYYHHQSWWHWGRRLYRRMGHRAPLIE